MIYVTHDQVEAMTLGDRIVLMHRGVIQQVDTPLNIYNHPANRFVGSFIGSPAMNMLAGEVHDGQFRAVTADASGDLTDDGIATIEVGEAIPNGEVVFGVRPEDLMTNGDGLPLARVTLEVVEQMGHETMAHFDLAGDRHVARLPAGTSVQRGDRLALSVRRGSYHLFAPDERGVRLN